MTPPSGGVGAGRAADRPRVAVYCPTYLPLTNTFIHRQLLGVSPDFSPFILTQDLEQPERFPFPDVFARGKKGALDTLDYRVRKALNRKSTLLTGAQDRFFGKVLKEEKAALIHAHWGNSGLEMLPLARRMGIPLLVTFHGNDLSSWLRRSNYARGLRDLFSTAWVIGVSRRFRDALARLGASEERLRLHYIGIPARFSFVERTPPGVKLLRGEPLRFLQVAGLREKKGHEITLRAFRGFLDRHPSATLDLVGDGPLRPRLEGLVKEMGLGGQVRFLGGVPEAEMEGAFAKADIFLHHSVTPPGGDTEGTVISVGEAMATGLVAVGSRHGGIPDMIEDGVNGFLAREGDLDEYAVKLELAAGAGPEIGRAAHRTIRERFDMDTQNRKLVEIYREAMAKG